MAEFDKLSSYIEEEGLKRSTEFIIAQFKEVEDRAELMAKNVQSASAKIYAKDTGAKARIDSVNDLEKKLDTYRKTLAKTTAEVDQLSDAQKKQVQSQVRAKKELTEAEIEARVNSQQRTAAIKKEILANRAAEGSYDALSLRLRALLLQYKALSEADRNSDIGKNLQKDISNTNIQLKTLDYGVGNYQRNVGNYAGSFQNFANTLRGVRGPTKLLGEALGIGAQEADQFRILIEHAAQSLAAFFKGKEEKAAAQAEETALNEANAASQVKSTVVTEAAVVATQEQVAAVEELVVTKAEDIAVTNTQLTTDERFAALTAAITVETEQRVAAEIALADAKFLSSTAGKENIAVTTAQAVAEKGYTAATVAASAATKIFMNVLKFSGIALAITAVAYLAYKIYEYRTALGEANKKQKEMNEYLKESEESFQKAFTEVNNLRESIKLAKEGFLNKAEVLKEYNNTLGKTTGEVKDLDKAEQELAKNGEKYIQITLLKAAANLALDAAAKKAFEAAELARKKETEFAKSFVDARIATPGTFNAAEYDADTKRIEIARKKRQKAEVDAANKSKDEQLDIARDFQKQAAEIAKTLSITDVAGKAGKKNKEAKENLQALKDLINTEFEIYKLQQERIIALFDKDVNATDIYYLKKYTALDNYVKASQELIDKQEANDIAAKRGETERQIEALKAERKGKDPAEIARINENIKIAEANLQQELNLIRAKSIDQSIKLAENAADKREKITTDQLKKELAQAEEFRKQEEDQIKKDDERIKKGFEERLRQEKEFAAKRLEIEKELTNAKYELAQQAESFLFTLATATFDRQNNLISDQKDEIDKRKEAEIAAASASVDTEEKKAAQIAIINARAQSQKDILDRKARENDYKKAKFDQAQQIFEIGIQTVKSIAAINLKAAELRAAAALNPLLLALIPVVLSQIPIALGLSALSIAGVLAKPLPKLKHGLQTDYEGHVIVGDGGKMEAITRKDGSIEITPATDTLAYISKGDRVHPDADVFMRDMQQAAIKDLVRVAGLQPFTERNYGQLMSKSLDKQTNILNKIANKRELHLGASRGGMEALWKWGSNQTKYLDQNTNW